MKILLLIYVLLWLMDGQCGISLLRSSLFARTQFLWIIPICGCDCCIAKIVHFIKRALSSWCSSLSMVVYLKNIDLRACHQFVQRATKVTLPACAIKYTGSLQRTRSKYIKRNRYWLCDDDKSIYQAMDFMLFYLNEHPFMQSYLCRHILTHTSSPIKIKKANERRGKNLVALGVGDKKILSCDYGHGKTKLKVCDNDDKQMETEERTNQQKHGRR